jgi:hypothetical protein
VPYCTNPSNKIKLELLTHKVKHGKEKEVHVLLNLVKSLKNKLSGLTTFNYCSLNLLSVL